MQAGAAAAAGLQMSAAAADGKTHRRTLAHYSALANTSTLARCSALKTITLQMANTDWQVGSRRAHSDAPARQYTLLVASSAAETQFEKDYIAKHIGK